MFGIYDYKWLSTLDRWSVWEDYSDLGGHVEILCLGFRWPLLRRCMGGDVDLQLVGLKWLKLSCWSLTWFKIPWRRSRWLEKGCWQLKVDKKTYVDHRRRELEFSVGDIVFLKVFPMRGTMIFGKKGKLSPRYMGPHEILERVNNVAYRVALSSNLEEVHRVFHHFMLRKHLPDQSHFIQLHKV